MQTPPSHQKDYYLLREYRMQAGPQTTLTERYFEEALIPALARFGMGPVGAFHLQFGPQTPTFYLLIPSTSVEALVSLDQRLSDDPTFLTAAQPFWRAPATAPAFIRIESSLLSAFSGWPRLVPPPASSGKTSRIFQLRTYESPSEFDHILKIKMFHSGEFEIFKSAGCHPVFFGDQLVGSRMPSSSYMLSFADMAELEAGWVRFLSDPRWKKLSSSAEYVSEKIVSNVSDLILRPLAASQV